MKTPENVPDNNVGRKTPEEIKKILGNPSNYTFGFYSLLNDALAYIQQLESRLAQAERERDAAVKVMRLVRLCENCKHCDKPCESYPCSSCAMDRERNKPNWEWRGVC